MGEAPREALQVVFDRSIKLEFHGAKVTSDAGLLPYRELDESLGLTTIVEDSLTDSRTGDNIQHDLVALLRQSVYSRLGGYEDTNDAERFRIDPTMRLIVGERAKRRLGASTSPRISELRSPILGLGIALTGFCFYAVEYNAEYGNPNHLYGWAAVNSTLIFCSMLTARKIVAFYCITLMRVIVILQGLQYIGINIDWIAVAERLDTMWRN